MEKYSEILNHIFDDQKYDISNYVNGFSVEEKKQFLRELLIHYPESYILRLLMCNAFLFINLSIKDWRDIYKDISNIDLALMTSSIFMKKYLCIDSISLLKELNSSNTKKNEVIEYFNERPGLFKFHPLEIKEIKEKYKKYIKKDIFYQIQANLESYGLETYKMEWLDNI